MLDNDSTSYTKFLRAFYFILDFSLAREKCMRNIESYNICRFNENLWKANTYYYNLDEAIAFWLKTWNWHMVPPHPQGNKPSRFYLFASESFIEFPLWVLKTVLKAMERHKASSSSPHKPTATLPCQWPVWQCPSSAFTSSVKDRPLEIKHHVAGLPLKGNCNLFSLVHLSWRRMRRKRREE